MKRISIVGVAAVAAIGASSLAQAKTAIVLKSVTVTLPQSNRAFPEGPGLETVKSNCVTCHSPGMILTQPRMPKAAWQAEVAKMRNVYKAPVDEKDVASIVDYLTAVKGPK